ncbi:MAG: hypothetical protein EOO20_24605, partial [Chryseobacterium sp.]
MSNKIEEYIRTNKKAFDDAKPPEALWGRIDAELNKKKIAQPVRLQVWIGMAASLLLVCSIAYFYISKSTSANGIIAEVNPAYAKKEMRFAT